MDGKNGMILWVLGGAGVLFLYSAYKAKSPQTVLLDHLNGTTAPASTPGPGVTPGFSNSVEPTSYSIGPGLGLSGPSVYDAGGLSLGPVPGPYAQNPNTFIPTIRNGGLINA